MDKKYTSALHAFPPFAQTAEEMLPAARSVHEKLTIQVTAPVLLTYVWYVLREAEKSGLKRLYFLARDGYIMLKIAQEIAKVCPVGLDLRYLYCSRASLRMPSYHRIPEDEMMDLLLHRGTNLTISHILDRADLTQEQRLALYAQLDIDAAEESAALDENDFAEICAKLRSCTLFREFVMANSSAAHTDAIAYFVQEGLTDGVPFGIVDTGWTGSMQRSLRQLSDDFPPITGFYFGMFARPKSEEDGTYKTWYFSADSAIGVRTKFNNNLFECLCAAPHSMTVGYEQVNGRYAPVFRQAANGGTMTDVIETQVALCTQFASLCAPRIKYEEFVCKTMHSISRALLQAMMYRPSAEEAAAYAVFTFCDDVTESYADSLVQYNCTRALHEHMPLTRIYRKLRGHKPTQELYWIYGTLAVSGLPLQALRRPALRLWDVLRCVLNKLKKI